jgi:glycerophosphoryl diester phosphodiesterase
MSRLSIPCAAILTFSTAFAGAQDQPRTIEEFYKASARTRVIAHRGFSGAAPENTMAAIRAAIEAKADMAEIDVTLSSDRQIVVLHDETLERTTDGRGEVSRLTFREIQRLDAGSWFNHAFAGERIPTLDQVLTEIEGKILLNIEIKSEAIDRGIVAEVATAIRDHGMVDRIVVSSFSPVALAKMHALAPEISTAVLYNPEYHRGRDAVDIVVDLGAIAFNIKRQRLTDTMLQRCRQHGIPVGLYTVNKPRRMRRLVEKGVSAIFTDHPDRLLEVLKRAQIRAPAPIPIPATTTP